MTYDYTSTRASKRRRVSGRVLRNDPGAEAFQFSFVSDRAAIHGQGAEKVEDAMNIDEDTETVAPVTPTRRSRRVTAYAGKTKTDISYADVDMNEEDRVDSVPSRRQRAAPARLFDTVEDTATSRARNKKGPSTTLSKIERRIRNETETQGLVTPSKRGGKKSGMERPEGQGIWEVPTDNEGSDGQIEDGFRESTLPPVSAPPEEEHADGEDDMIAAQLHDWIAMNGESVIEAEELPKYADEFRGMCEENALGSQLGSLAQCILEKLTGKRLIPLEGLDAEYQTVHQLVEQTIVAGEGNSLLLLGSRGSGKTAVVETVLSSLSRAHGDDFHVVRLNGFLHTDDRIAVREIWRQLGRETNAEEDNSKITSSADTMSSLLALLSHPEELFGPNEDPNATTAAKSVVIVLNEFDLFSYHPRQTLLYNLFDIAQARKAPIAVLGLTTKVDVTENLEKRVKSRFSHRYVFFPRPRTFTDFSKICMAALLVDENEFHGTFENSKGASPGARKHLLSTGKGKILLKGWRKYLQVRNFPSFLNLWFYLHSIHRHIYFIICKEM